MTDIQLRKILLVRLHYLNQNYPKKNSSANHLEAQSSMLNNWLFLLFILASDELQASQMCASVLGEENLD